MASDHELIHFLISRLGRDRLYEYIDPYRDSFKVYIAPISILHPHEAVNENHLNLVMRELITCRYIKYPIVVDARTLTILDGHHRVEAFKKLGVDFIPIFLIDYAQDYVEVYPLRKEIPVSKIGVLDKAVFKKSLYPPKTTRHVYYGFTVPPTYIQLSILEKSFNGAMGNSSELYVLPRIRGQVLE